MMVRRFSTRVAEGRTIFNRKEELAALNARLVAALGETGNVVSGGNLVVVSEPKDSGKSSLLREFLRRQKEGDYPGVSCMADMRDISSETPTGVARMLKSTFLPSVEGSSLSFRKVDDHQQLLEKEDDMDSVLATIKSYGGSLSGRPYSKAFPTIVLDEANRLQSWATDPETRKDLEQLLAFFVKATTQERIMNVVLASSESFFQAWLEGYIGSLRVDTVNVGDLNEAEAREFFVASLPSGSPRVSDEMWKDIYSHMGGRIGLLAKAARGVEAWESLKASLLSSCRLDVQLACFPEDLPGKRRWTGDDWWTVVSTLMQHKDGVMSYMSLCNKLSVAKVNSLIEHGLLQYVPLTAWGTSRNIEAKSEDWPLVMPATMLHFRAMQETSLEVSSLRRMGSCNGTSKTGEGSAPPETPI